MSQAFLLKIRVIIFAQNRVFLGSNSDREHDLTTLTEDDARVR